MLRYLNELREVKLDKVTTYPKASDSLSFKLMLAAFYSLYDKDGYKDWSTEKIKGTWSRMHVNRSDELIAIEEEIITKERLLRNTGRNDDYTTRASDALEFSFLLRGKGIINYIGYDSILLLIDKNSESILENDNLIKKLVCERFDYIFYIKNDTAVLIEVEELRRNYWRER